MTARARAACQAPRRAARGHLPAAGFRGQRPSELRGRPGRRDEPRAGTPPVAGRRDPPFGGGAERHHDAGLHADRPRGAARRSSRSPPIPTRPPASIPRTLAITARPGRRPGGASVPPARPAAPTEVRWPRGPTTRDGRHRRKRPATVKLEQVILWLRDNAGPRHDPDERRGQLRGVPAPLLPLPPARDAGCPDLRLHGLRPARRRRRQAAQPRADRGLPRRGRLPADDHPGAVDRPPARRRHHRRDRQQRPLRHDPHASGKPLPGRVSGTELFNPDYVQLAQAYGGTGHRITRPRSSAPPSRPRARAACT
jgi:hypothetical protein